MDDTGRMPNYERTFHSKPSNYDYNTLMRKMITFFMLVIILTACHVVPTIPQLEPSTPTRAVQDLLSVYTSTPDATPIFNPSPRLGKPFSLSGGQTISLRNEGLTLRFLDVIDDSRCPAMVICEWVGEARIVLSATLNDAHQQRLELCTLANENQGAIGGFTVTLQAVVPYPQTPDYDIPFEAYNITLLVEQISPE